MGLVGLIERLHHICSGVLLAGLLDILDEDGEGDFLLSALWLFGDFKALFLLHLRFKIIHNESIIHKFGRSEERCSRSWLGLDVKAKSSKVGGFI
jgi:hypothetical protein